MLEGCAPMQRKCSDFSTVSWFINFEKSYHAFNLKNENEVNKETTLSE